jgi:protein-tyrosine phosphatase
MSVLDRVLRWLGLDFEFDLRGATFDRITPDLYLGARPRPEDLPALREAGITRVVSCLPGEERPLVAFLDEHVDTWFFPLVDGMDADLAPLLPRFFEVLDEADGPVLVHCQVGVSRSASLAIAAVMRGRGLRFYEAFGEVRSRRPQVLPNIGFASQLQRFEHARHPVRAVASLTRYLDEICHVPVEATTLQAALEDHDYDAVAAIRAIFGGEIPRVVQGVR